MLKELEEIEAALVKRSTVGDTVTDAGVFDVVAAVRKLLSRVREQDRCFQEPRVDPHGKEGFRIPEDWEREEVDVDGQRSVAFVIRADDSRHPGYQFRAYVFFAPKIAAWRSHVTLNGWTIFQEEERQVDVARYRAKEAIHRAWHYRGPVYP